VITAFGDEETRELAQRFGAHAILDKPIEPDELERAVRGAIGGSSAPHPDVRVTQ
jgi:DNA-binding NarL/FixJ family response regulator